MSKISFTNKVVVITGGSEGIGKALVDLFLQKGARVATCGRNFDKLYQLQTFHAGKPLLTHTADISKQSECESFIQKVIKAYGAIDVLINNAGISMRALFKDTNVATLQKLMDVNFWGTVYCTKLALPYLIQSKGIIVGVSSVAGFVGLPGRSGYSASKAAMNGWLATIRTELKDTGVSVITVCPGFTASNIRKVALNKHAQPEDESKLDEGRLMSAEVCAQHIYNAAQKKKRMLILTSEGRQAVFFSRFFPSLTDALVHKFYFKKGQFVK